MTTPAVVFDLDGTLVDSVPDIAAAVNRMARRHGLAPFRQAEIAAMVGDGAAALVDRAFAARHQPMAATAVAEFLLEYRAEPVRGTRSYPHVAAVLAALRADGYRLAVCTNKPEHLARTILEHLNLDAFFAAIGGGDSFPTRKPDPAHLLNTLRIAGGAPEQAVMVGDHHNDIQAACGAGMASIFAGWGYGDSGMASGTARGTVWRATALARRFEDLPGVIRRLSAGPQLPSRAPSQAPNQAPSLAPGLAPGLARSQGAPDCT